jgi:hypothetical protein
MSDETPTLRKRLRVPLSTHVPDGSLSNYLSALWHDEGAKVALATAVAACLSLTQGVGLLLLLPLLQLVGFNTQQGASAGVGGQDSLPIVADEGETFVKRFWSGPEHAVTTANRAIVPDVGIVGTAMG